MSLAYFSKMALWELARQIDQMHSHPRYNKLKQISLFGGMLYCMDCGFAMRHQTEQHKRKNGSVVVYESYTGDIEADPGQGHPSQGCILYLRLRKLRKK